MERHSMRRSAEGPRSRTTATARGRSSRRAGSSGSRPPDADHYVRIHAAGGCSARGDGGGLQRLFKAGVRVPRSRSSDSCTVRWADMDADATWQYDVQYRVANGAWTCHASAALKFGWRVTRVS